VPHLQRAFLSGVGLSKVLACVLLPAFFMFIVVSQSLSSSDFPFASEGLRLFGMASDSVLDTLRL